MYCFQHYYNHRPQGHVKSPSGTLLYSTSKTVGATVAVGLREGSAVMRIAFRAVLGFPKMQTNGDHALLDDAVRLAVHSYHKCTRCHTSHTECTLDRFKRFEASSPCSALFSRPSTKTSRLYNAIEAYIVNSAPYVVSASPQPGNSASDGASLPLVRSISATKRCTGQGSNSKPPSSKLIRSCVVPVESMLKAWLPACSWQS